MTHPTDDTTPPDHAAGLADPRTSHHGPEMFEPSAGLDPATGPADAQGPKPPGHDGADDPDAGARGLVDPRGEIPDPTGP